MSKKRPITLHLSDSQRLLLATVLSKPHLDPETNRLCQMVAKILREE